MEVMLEFIVMVVFGAMCAMIASSRGRSGPVWFCIGFIFTCIALIILLVIEDLSVKDEKERQMRRENRRLREQLKKDRAVADSRHVVAERRLTAHDRALGVDTAPLPVTAPLDSQPEALPSADLVDVQWYYLDEGRERQGPLVFPDFKRLWRESTIGARTLVWSKTFTDWVALSDVPGLEDELRG